MNDAKVHPMAGQPAPLSLLVNVPRLVTAFYTERPDPSVRAQRVTFGTSGHRGSSRDVGFNEGHILAITQAICSYRKEQGIDGPLFLGWDTHALSEPARVCCAARGSGSASIPSAAPASATGKRSASGTASGSMS